MALRVDMQRGFVDSMQKYLPNDAQSRHNWSMAAAAIMVCNWTPEQLNACVDQGYRRFISIARPIMHGHGFHDEDYRRMFEVVRKAASMNPSKSRDFINKIIIEASR